MASLTFASPGEVVEPANLPGFHNIIILDAVLSQTLSLVDIHYQKLKESSSDGEHDIYAVLYNTIYYAYTLCVALHVA